MCLCQIWITLTIKKILINLISVFPLYGIWAPFLLKFLRREMSSLPEGFLFTAFTWQTFFIKRYLTQPSFSKQTASMWSNILQVGLEDTGFGLMTMGGNRDPLGSFCCIAALKRLGSKSDQLICKSVFICTCMGFLFPS